MALSLAGSSTAAAFLGSFISLSLAAAFVALAPDDAVLPFAVAPAGTSGAFTALLSTRFVRATAIGAGSAVGAAFAFGPWFAHHLSTDQATSTLLLAWVLGVAVMAVLVGFAATIGAWAVLALRRRALAAG